MSPSRPAHRQLGLICPVALGGAFGALARQAATSTWSHHGFWPWPILVVNLAGALVLGALLEALTRSGPDAGIRRTTRLLVGTGFCGAFTTYSTFSHDVATLGHRHVLDAAGWGLAEVTLGVGAVVVGATLGAKATRTRTEEGTS